jgi:FkbM family methyltransferase
MTSLNPDIGNILQELPPDHDLSHLRAALPHCQQYRVALDIGAHQGIWAVEMAKKFDQVFAFEPVLSNWEILNKRVEWASNCALGAISGMGVMVPGPRNTGQYHIAPTDMDEINGEQVDMYTVDEFQFNNVDFIKIDVEGYELPVIAGAIKTIEKNKPVIMIEENGLCERYGIASGEAGRLLEDHGYLLKGIFNKDYVYCPY